MLDGLMAVINRMVGYRSRALSEAESQAVIDQMRMNQKAGRQRLSRLSEQKVWHCPPDAEADRVSKWP